jgi:DNA polymerase III subunit delta
MTETNQHIFILHGDDEVAMHAFIQDQKHSLGDPEMAEMSISTLDGKTVSEADLRNAAFAVSFFSSERLVILTDPISRYESKRSGGSEEEPTGKGSKQKAGRSQFLKFLEEVPETTRIVLLVDDQQKWRSGKNQWEVLDEKHFLSKWANEHAETVKVIGYPLPSRQEMPGWIQKKALELGGKIAPDAAAELAVNLGSDTRLATLELDKLITYCNGRAIQLDDVIQISTSVMSSTIWNLTEAIGEKDARKAVAVLHQLMETMDVRQDIFPMIIWQFRQFLLGREVLDEGGNQGDLMRELHLADFQARKLFEQVKRFQLPAMRWAYRQLMKIEDESKRSMQDISVQLDQMIVQLCTQNMK